MKHICLIIAIFCTSIIYAEEKSLSESSDTEEKESFSKKQSSLNQSQLTRIDTHLTTTDAMMLRESPDREREKQLMCSDSLSNLLIELTAHRLFLHLSVCSQRLYVLYWHPLPYRPFLVRWKLKVFCMQMGGS